jgi:carbonic anhydrase/acetyltransferase-like protein (isoleucine patch superfamily)
MATSGGGTTPSTPAAPDGSLTLHPTAVIALDAEFRGKVTVGAQSILHPNCKILNVGGGSIEIGKGCIIEENVLIANRYSSLRLEDWETSGVD